MRAAFILAVALLSMMLGAPSHALNVALYYGQNLPRDELRAFDVVVVEPDHVPEPSRYNDARSQLYAYVSVGEVQPSRAYFGRIEPRWQIGRNEAWGSIVIDQSQPDWHAFFIAEIVRPLVQRGFAGLFLDTLDSYHLVAKTDQARAAQEAGLIALVRAIKSAYPTLALIFNRGFEILPSLHEGVQAVAFESLYRGWNQSAREYGEVPAADREWVLKQLEPVVQRYKLPVIAIDYVPPHDRELARATAARIRAHGFAPYVADPAFESLGVGNLEVFPRKVLFVYAARGGRELNEQTGHQVAQMPLNYLGYTVEYARVDEALPPAPLNGRYAGIVSWLSGDEARGTDFPEWLKTQLEHGMRYVALEGFGFTPDPQLLELLGLEAVAGSGNAPVQIAHRDPIVGFEHEPVTPAAAYGGYRVAAGSGGVSILRFATDAEYFADVAAWTRSGGFLFAPNALVEVPRANYSRWVVQPIEFLRRALARPEMPVPDVTTENGRRLMLVHIDGDGFPSRAEMPGTPLAGEALRREVLEKYRVPTTMSIIQGEVSPRGLFKQLAPVMEAEARKIFALPHVELASHSLSHPFFWKRLVDGERPEKAGTMNLALPGYEFDLLAEIPGSIEYINATLAPPGKRAQLMLWTGDCMPPEGALKVAYESGLLNMNGGDTVITRSRNSWTLIAPLGVQKGQFFQVYAPNQNENVYTNEWTGPFYGFERVIETFELTESPYRFKPINIYYHTYAVTKQASLRALHKIYQFALAQAVMNVYSTEYVRKVLDFNRMVVARDWANDGWRIRAVGDLRTVRLAPDGAVPDLARSRGVAGSAPGPSARYVHLSGDEVFLKTLGAGDPANPVAALHSANGRLIAWSRNERSVRTTFEAHVPLEVEFDAAASCTLHHNGRAVAPKRAQGQRKHYVFEQSGRHDLELVCA